MRWASYYDSHVHQKVTVTVKCVNNCKGNRCLIKTVWNRVLHCSLSQHLHLGLFMCFNVTVYVCVSVCMAPRHCLCVSMSVYSEWAKMVSINTYSYTEIHQKLFGKMVSTHTHGHKDIRKSSKWRDRSSKWSSKWSSFEPRWSSFEPRLSQDVRNPLK